MKTEKGNRKVYIAQQSALFLLAGLLVMFFGAWITGQPLKDILVLYFYFAFGVVGKDAAFIYGNAKEHQAAPGATVQPPKPAV